MEECKIKNLYNLEETIAKELLEKSTYPWEVLPNIGEYILNLGEVNCPLKITENTSGTVP